METLQIKEIPLNVSFFFSIPHVIKNPAQTESSFIDLFGFLSILLSSPVSHTVTTRVVLWCHVTSGHSHGDSGVQTLIWDFGESSSNEIKRQRNLVKWEACLSPGHSKG